MTTADLVIYEKSFQAAVDEAVAQSGNDNVLDTATVVPLMPLQEGDQHDHAEEAGEEHGESGLDPHVWLDPHNVVQITDAVASKLAAVDPAHAADYTANAKTPGRRADRARRDVPHRAADLPAAGVHHHPRGVRLSRPALRPRPRSGSTA